MVMKKKIANSIGIKSSRPATFSVVDNPITTDSTSVTVTNSQNNINKNKKNSTKNIISGTLYIGRIPHGFYEKQMREYFSQFGEITHLRLSRNKKTGASKHYAFIQFKYPEVAAIVAETMNNYLLFNSLLQCKLIPQEKVHPEIWKGADKRFKKVPWLTITKKAHNRKRTKEETEKRNEKRQKRLTQKLEKIQSVGIDYNFGSVKKIVKD